jgi:drug/metabolite transporter (DMT)-like permease
MGASRVLVAGTLLFIINALRGQRLRPTRSELHVLVVTGLLLWVGGNGAVNWAEQRIDSGLAALIVGTMPIWVALMEAVVDRRRPSLLLIGSLIMGFAGLALLTLPGIRDGISGDAVGIGAVLFAAVSWGAGSIFLNRCPVRLDPIVTSSWQQLIGGVGFVAIAVFVGEAAPNPSPEGWLAWGYLVVFGSMIAFSSFVIAIKLLPTAVVMTYSYVNPVIAVFLGWLILSESVTMTTLFATALIVAAVLGVFRDKAHRTDRIPSRSEHQFKIQNSKFRILNLDYSPMILIMTRLGRRPSNSP